MREYNWAFENNWFQNKPWPFFDRVSTAPGLFSFSFFFPFLHDATVSELRMWHALLILLSANASPSRQNRGWCSFSRKVCVTRSLHARFIILAEYSCFPCSRLFSPCIYSGQFFCLRASANTLAAENYSFDSIFPFFYTLPIFLIDYRYFNDVNNFRNFNNYSSGIYLDQRLYTVFQLFNEIEVFYRYVKMSFSVYFAKNSVSIPKTFYQTFSV